MSKVQLITISDEFSDQRIDNYLITKLKGVPRSHIYRILRKGEVRVNKKRAAPSYRLISGDQIRIPPLKLAPTEKTSSAPSTLVQFLKRRIVYEDNNLIIINKPTGIPVHGGSQVKIGLIEAMRQIFPALPHLELAHRLDADTSGCLILAKKRSILRELHALLREGKIKKNYFALTKGTWSNDELRVNAPLKKNYLSSGERIVKVQKEGKDSLTIFKPIEIFNETTLVEAQLMTGRTHQIRVHTQSKRHPIAGDEKYGDREFNKRMKKMGLKRLFLHAHSLEFILPSTGQKINAISPLDIELSQVLDQLRLTGC